MVSDREGPRREADLLGTWLARLGALAVLVGAGFAFRYAIDRGWIGPEARVGLGLVVGLGFLAWGEWAIRRTWRAFAQAVTAGGVGLLYLSILAGFHLYGLFPAGLAFGLLGLVAGGTVALAIRHDAQPMAVLAIVGAFLNPFLVGVDASLGDGLLAYVLVVDVGVLAIAAVRRWPALDGVAYAATWVIAALALPVAPDWALLGFGAAYVALFNGRNLLHGIRGEGGGAADLVFVLPGTLVFTGLGLLALEGSRNEGAFVLTLGLAHVLLGLVWLQAARDRLPALAQFGLGAGLAALAAPILLEGPIVGAAWAVDGIVLVWLGRRFHEGSASGTGAGLLALGVVLTTMVEIEAGTGYLPGRVLLSGESAALLLEVAALALAAFLLRGAPQERWDGATSRLFAGGAYLLGVGWMLLEAHAAFDRLAPWAEGSEQFTYTAILGAYAGVTMVVGIFARSQPARLIAAWLLIVTIAKLVVVDLWMMEVFFRMVAFIGLGALLLLLSVMYHRFRDLILEDRPPAPRPERPAVPSLPRWR